MNTILIEVRGGVVQQVYSAGSNVKVLLVDWDNIASGDDIASAHYPTRPLAELPVETRVALSRESAAQL